MFLLSKGLNIDIVKPGSGTSNDGNTARAFFRGTQELSIDKALISKI